MNIIAMESFQEILEFVLITDFVEEKILATVMKDGTVISVN